MTGPSEPHKTGSSWPTKPGEWRSERRAENPHPEAGLASSLQVGLAALGEEVGAALVLLADQPRVRSIVIRRLADAWRGGAGPIVAPRYSRDAAPNPVLIDRTAWPLACFVSTVRVKGTSGSGWFTV